MEETIATELTQVVAVDPALWEQLIDLLRTSITVNTMAFLVICLGCGILLGQALWRWMR